MAFAASDAHAGVRPGWQPLSTEWAYYHALKRDGGTPHDGTTMSGMLEALQLDGQADEAAWPYITELFTDSSTWVPPKVRSVYRRKSTPQTPTVKAIIDHLDNDEPVLFTMSISKSFFNPNAGGIVDALEHVEPKRIHALVAVGHGRSEHDTYILVRNSWGEAWGIEGYGWVATSYLEPRLLSAATMAGEL